MIKPKVSGRCVAGRLSERPDDQARSLIAVSPDADLSGPVIGRAGRIVR
jgi:hypothetical protein